MARLARGLQQRAGGVDVAAQAQVQVALAVAAHRRGQVHHGVDAAQSQRAALQQVEQVAGEGVHARIGRQVGGRRHEVGEPELVNGLRRAAGQCHRPLSQQRACKTRTEEATAARDEDAHFRLLPVKAA
ncbi:hypothetical protein D9M69_621990 [compost metagenome]